MRSADEVLADGVAVALLPEDQRSALNRAELEARVEELRGIRDLAAYLLGVCGMALGEGRALYERGATNVSDMPERLGLLAARASPTRH
jgi:hypothetical protein